ncbi:hypothetical protein MYMAC_000091 [Corallococcus macrosporus DSM 14697]|uniref:Uncharacterized protein n=1 Tax=Corallococcus macrosporus DSM 14697 TaxID=1189310 RepID=A0A250JLK4_9BACT|nr:hypothetical protein MYMAC_000091 [Corallococcus macrosporus DSM 14697]
MEIKITFNLIWKVDNLHGAGIVRMFERVIGIFHARPLDINSTELNTSPHLFDLFK